MGTKYKTISANESQFLKKLDDEGRSWAYISDLYEMFPQQSKESVRVTVKRMVDKGLLAKFGKDLVWVVPFNMEADTFLPDWHLMAEPLAGGNKYYIGYYSALQVHGLERLQHTRDTRKVSHLRCSAHQQLGLFHW